VAGDIAEDATSEKMVRVAVETYGGIDAAINNAGAVDALHPEEKIDSPTRRTSCSPRSTRPGTITGSGSRR
jgi:NAD(P)-dependent dehydrogenase (short-subunit alcohol dehydrogenase family)